ncbi:MAG: tetratricopeptide repeat protein [Bacteroidales bacterium]|jgi:tetratricopeptide (TPR) repeat protein|nr:tetratricopeptide repeat protein [Bacteroidales bacterium]
MKLQTTKYSLISLLLMVSFSLSAQKEVRHNVRKGNKAYNEQKYSEAARFYQQAIKENSQSKEANFNLGNALYKQKEWDKSIEQMNRYLMIEREDPVKMSAAWHNIGNAFLQKKEVGKAIEAYKNALRLNPDDEETRYNLAVAQKMLKDQQDKSENQDQENQDKQQQQQQDNQEQQQPEDKREKRPEKQDAPEQMSRDNARQLLQAIEQDEKETQEKVQQIKAQQREQKAQELRRQNKDW